MHYITVAEYESPGTMTCKIQGLREETSRDLANYLRKNNTISPVNSIIFSEHDHKSFFEIDTEGVWVLNLLSRCYFYKVKSQSTVIEVSNIGGRTDKVQKTIWTLEKNETNIIVQ